MARVAIPSTVASALLKQRGPLRAYQWLWLLLCIAGALAAAAPRILSRPLIFRSESVSEVDITQNEVARGYGSLITAKPDEANYAAKRSDFDAVAAIATTLVRLKDRSYSNLGSPAENQRLNLAFTPNPDGRITIAATAPNPDTARRLADDGAEAFARSLRASGGREIFRKLMGWEQYAASTGVPARDAFQQQLRLIWVYDAFRLNRAFDLSDQTLTVDMLTAEQRSDLARAFEVREQELSNIDLFALRGRIAAATGEEQNLLRKDEQRLLDGLAAIRSALGILYNQYDAAFIPDAASAVYRSQKAGIGQEIDRQIMPLLALTMVVGLVFGGLGVAVDRSAGVMTKLREIWEYRELIRNLVLRDLRVRYKGSVLGYLWTQLAPLLLMLVFLFVFSTLQKQPTALFPVFLIVGLLPWNFCAEAVTGGSRSILDNANLIKKVFFPREILPMVSVFSALLNYVLSLPMMLLVMAVAQTLYPKLGHPQFSWTFAYLPILVIIQAVFLTGLVFFISALAVRFRDFVHLVGILVQFWFFLTPVVYPLAALNLSPNQATLFRWLNPMASLIEFYRETLYGSAVAVPEIPRTAIPAPDSIFRVVITAVLVLTVGYWFFQRQSRTFGESI